MSDPRRFGWHPIPEETARVVGALPLPTLASVEWLKDAGRGKVVLLHKAFAAIGAPVPLREQTIGDCVSQAYAGAVDVLAAVEIAIKGEPESWPGAETATEPIYAASRVEIGKGRVGRGDGSVGAWAAEAVSTLGTIPRGKYGEIDLTRYDGRRARAWGAPRAGLPDDLEWLMAGHKIGSTSLVESYEQARDAIASGYPVVVCSNQGFTMSRDAQGFCRPRGIWPHAMLFLAVDDTGDRPGLLCQNSWGDYLQGGGTRHAQPPGSFWVDAAVADKMLRQGDSFALASYAGFPRRDELPWA